MAVNIVVSLSLMPFIGAYGIPLAYSAASIVGLCNLLWQLKRKVGSFATGMGKEIVKSIVCAVLMAVAVGGVNAFLDSQNFADSFGVRVIVLIVPAFVGVCVYAVLGYILKIEAVRQYADKLRAKIH